MEKGHTYVKLRIVGRKGKMNCSRQDNLRLMSGKPLQRRKVSWKAKVDNGESLFEG